MLRRKAMKEDQVIQVARATHEMNRRYCQLIGDHSQVPWEKAPQWQRDSATAGVESILDGTATSSEDQHELWMKHKLADGWTYGEVKDAEKKTHPCMVPYAELPASQRAKDKIFRAVVEGLLED